MLSESIKNLHIITVGHVTHDQFEQHMTVGGSAFFAALIAKQLGAHTRLWSAVGHDFQYDQIINQIDRYFIKSQYTSLFHNLYLPDQSRTQRLTHRSIDLYPQHFESEICKIKTSNQHIDLLFLAPVIGEINPQDSWKQHLHPKLLTLSLQGLLRQVYHDQHSASKIIPRTTALPSSYLKDIDVLFVSDEDLIGVHSEINIEFLSQHVPLVFLTHGEKGCSIYQKDHTKIAHINVYPTQVVDPTGAGDTFAIATSLALLSHLNPIQAAYFGSAAASIVIEDFGSHALSYIDQVYDRFHILLDQYE